MNKDLTEGKPQIVLWQFCLPLFASVVFQQIYNIADSLVAGKFIGENALAAVGNSYEITLIFIAIAFGSNIGCSVVVSRFFGAKKYAEVKTTVYTTWITCVFLCLIMMLSGFIFAENLLSMINTPASIMADSLLYLRIYILGLPFLLFYNISTGIFSALGDSKTPFYFLAFSSTANILVDIYFVASLKMGIAGVAWATFICQGLSCVCSVIFVFRRVWNIRCSEKAKCFSIGILRQIAVIAIPSILQQSFISIGNILIQGIINGFGPSVIAGYSASIKLNNLVITSFSTLGNGISNYTSQNFGAGKTDRIKMGLRAGTKMVWAICAPVAIVYTLFGRNLIGFFMDKPSDVALNSGVSFLHIVVAFYFVISVKLVVDGILRGMALMKFFMCSTFTDLILRVVLAYIFSARFGVIGIWYAWPVGWSVATVMSLYFYYNKVGKTKE